MPLNGEYEPSPSERVRRQVELYEATNGTEGGTLNGKPVIVLTSQGAKSGKIRKIPLMRIEHNGVYAVVASYAGAPKNPFWYYNLVANPLVELQDGAVKQDMRAREVFGEEKAEWWKRADAAYSEFPNYRARTSPRNSAVRYRARRGCAIHKQAAAGMIELDLGITAVLGAFVKEGSRPRLLCGLCSALLKGLTEKTLLGRRYLTP